MPEDTAGTAAVAAAAAAEASAVVLPSETPQETLLAGKYKTPQELERAYKELEKKLGAPRTPEKPAAVAPKPGTTPAAIPEGAAEAAGVNLDALTAEYAEKGELSEASLATLAKAGIPKTMVDDYIAGQEARAVAQVAKVHGVVGGEGEYQTLIGWAATNLPAEDIAAFNRSMASGDFSTQKMAVESLQGKYIKTAGSGPNVIVGGAGSPGSAQGYESRAQMTQDMKDPRYTKDPAFREKVIAKLAKTTSF